MAERLNLKVVCGIELLFYAMMTREQVLVSGTVLNPSADTPTTRVRIRGMVNGIEAEDGSGHSWLINVSPAADPLTGRCGPSVKLYYHDERTAPPESVTCFSPTTTKASPDWLQKWVPQLKL